MSSRILSDQLFDSAQETAYRLCVCPPPDISVSDRPSVNTDSPSSSSRRIFRENIFNSAYFGQEKVFSLCVDPNDPNTLFVCSHNGRLHVFNTLSNESQVYHVVFRPFSFQVSDAEVNVGSDEEQEKILTEHWDKLSLIPNRPGEIIFLLGISKKIMYSKIPSATKLGYPRYHLVSNSSKRYLSTFLHGSVISEIYSHSNRITSLGVSENGHLLASGDENGSIKVYFLPLLEELNSTPDDILHRSVRSFASSEHNPRYLISQNIHSGPIFSVHWLLSTTQSSDSNTHYLITGSNDRALRIWSVTASYDHGLQLKSCIAMTTISASILCISSFRYFDPTQDQMNQTIIRARRVSTNNSPSNSTDLVSPVSYFISAGTHLGTIYIWRIHHDDIIKWKTHLSAFDDGSYLLSLLPSWDIPIVSVNLRLMKEIIRGEGQFEQSFGTKERLILTSLDTHSNVNVHKEVDAIDEESSLKTYRAGFGPVCFFQQFTDDQKIVSIIPNDGKSVENDFVCAITITGAVLKFRV